jgi:hypothetical protein
MGCRRKVQWHRHSRDMTGSAGQPRVHRKAIDSEQIKQFETFVIKREARKTQEPHDSRDLFSESGGL